MPTHKQSDTIAEPALYHLKIMDWPVNERPREKLLARGPESLTEAELLAILLRSGAGKITAVDLGKKLLEHFGSLEGVAQRSVGEFLDFYGMGEVKAITLVAGFELGRRRQAGGSDAKVQVRSPEDVVNRYQSVMRDLKHEIFKVILLDSANHILRDAVVSHGILNSSLAHPREVFRPAILEPAASVILIHNHPSGNPEPSAEDIQITRQIVEAGKVIGIPVHDHVIIAGTKYTSFAERGLIG